MWYVAHVQVVGEGVPHVDSEKEWKLMQSPGGHVDSQSMETTRTKTPVMAAGDRVSATGCVRQACRYIT